MQQIIAKAPATEEQASSANRTRSASRAGLRAGRSVRYRTDTTASRDHYRSASSPRPRWPVDRLPGHAQASPMTDLDERNRNSAPFRTTGTRAAVDCRNLHLCVGGLGYPCDRPLDPRVLRRHSKRGRAAQAWSTAERIRQRTRDQSATPRGSTGYDHPPKPGALSRVRRRRIDAEDRASRRRRRAIHCQRQDREKRYRPRIRQCNRR
jgi:hypothetical protein